MVTLNITVDEDLHARLERELRLTGMMCSAFVCELIERELWSKEVDGQTVTVHPIMRFKGVIQGEPDSRDDALRVDEILAGRDNNADSDLR